MANDVARHITEREAEQLRKAQARFERIQRETEARVTAGQLARDALVAGLLDADVRATDVARTLNVTRQSVYLMADRAKREQ